MDAILDGIGWQASKRGRPPPAVHGRETPRKSREAHSTTAGGRSQGTQARKHAQARDGHACASS